MTSGKRKFIAYYRVSTLQQAESDLGLRSQKSSIRNYISSINGELVNEYKEVESGANKDRITFGADINLETLLSRRPLLLKAIEEAKKEGAYLIAKEVTRITRFSLLFNYLEATGVKLVCTDYTNDDSFMLKLRVQFGEEEAKQISKRTIAGLSKSTKPKGSAWKKNLEKVDHKNRINIIKTKALNQPSNKRASGYVCTLINDKQLTLKQVADKLNAEGFKTVRGKTYSPTTVKRIYDKFCN